MKAPLDGGGDFFKIMMSVQPVKANEIEDDSFVSSNLNFILFRFQAIFTLLSIL